MRALGFLLFMIGAAMGLYASLAYQLGIDRNFTPNMLLALYVLALSIGAAAYLNKPR